MMQRLAYASPEWVAVMRSTLVELVAAAREDLLDADFSMCEVIADVPPSGDAVVLGARFKGGQVEFFEEPGPADVTVRGDYAAMLPGARLAHRGASPDDMAALASHRREMVATGRLSSTGDMSAASKPLLRVLSRMHDRMAERTL